MKVPTDSLREVIHKEIDLIESCISRMSQHSFYLKGWTISLVGIIVMISKKSNNNISIILIIMTVFFWYLNAYFLRLERMYRKLYDWVITKRINNKTDFLYDLNAHRFEGQVEGILVTMFSKTLFCFYGMIVILLIIFRSWII